VKRLPPLDGPTAWDDQSSLVDSSRAAEATVAHRLARQAAVGASRATFVDGATGRSVSFDHIERQAAIWKAAFSTGSIVAVSLGAPLSFCAAYLAALAAQVTIAPLDPSATPAEIDLALTRLRATDLVLDPGHVGGHSKRTRLWSFDGSHLRPLSDPSTSDPTGVRTPEGATTLGGDRAAVLLATSGTTGQPKVVPLGEHQLLEVAGSIVAHHGLDASDRGYCPLPLFHVNAQVVGVLSTLVAGSSLVVDDRFHRSRFWEVVVEQDVTWLNLVPAMITILADTSPPDGVLAKVRFARSASAPLPPSTLSRFEQATGIGVLETYGMTEAASQITANPLDPADRRPGSAGKAVGTDLRVVDEARHRVPPGVIGSIEIAGPGVIEAYLDHDLVPLPARTPDGWLVTGDLGRMDPDGFVYLVGRADEVINRGGEKCYPREIEEVLRSHPRVRLAAVVGRPHHILGAEPVAFVVASPQPGPGPDEQLIEELATECRRVLSRHKRPATIYLVDRLPTGATGKVSHRRVACELLPLHDREVCRQLELKGAQP